MFKAIPAQRTIIELQMVKKIVYAREKGDMSNQVTYVELDKIKDLVDLNEPTIDDLDDFWYRIIRERISKLSDYSYNSLILYTITKKYLLSNNSVKHILEMLCNCITMHNSHGGIFKWRLSFYWLDAMILNGYKMTPTETVLLDKLGYVKSYLLQDFKHITVADLEMLFTASNIINDIVSDNKTKIDAIIDLVKLSGHKITNRCVLLAIKTGLGLCDQQIWDCAWIHRGEMLHADDMQKFKPIIYTFFNRLFSFFELLNYKYRDAPTFAFERILKMVFAKKINYFCDGLNDIILQCVIEYLESKQVPIKISHICNIYDVIKFGLQYLLSKCDPLKDPITDNDIKCILSNNVLNIDAIKLFQQKFDYKFSQEIFEYAFRTNNNVLLNLVCSQQTFDCTPCCVKYAFEYGNHDMIRYVLEQKITPSDKNIESLCISPNIANIQKIINMLHIYGISMSQKTKELIVLTIGQSLESFNMEPSIVDRLKYIFNSYPAVAIKNKGMNKLRAMFRCDKIETIQNYIKTSKLVPDIYCFENAVIGQNLNAIMYAAREYGYIPTMPIIMKCRDFNVRVGLLNKFYPHMMIFNYLSDQKSIVKPVSDPKVESIAKQVVEPKVESIAKPVSEPKVKPIAKQVVEPKVPPIAKPVSDPKVKPIVKQVVESETHILLDERPIKKISKKTTSKPASNIMFVSFD